MLQLCIMHAPTVCEHTQAHTHTRCMFVWAKGGSRFGLDDDLYVHCNTPRFPGELLAQQWREGFRENELTMPQTVR